MAQYNGETYEYLKERRYYQVSRAYRIVSRLDIPILEMRDLFIKENFGDTTSGLPSLGTGHMLDHYIRCYSKDKIHGVPTDILKQLGTVR